jgi:hypothetical protein
MVTPPGVTTIAGLRAELSAVRLKVFGKQPSAVGSQLNAIGGLTLICVELSGSTFLVDTGAEVSVLPHCSTFLPSLTILTAAASQAILSWGSDTCKLCFGAKIFFYIYLGCS